MFEFRYFQLELIINFYPKLITPSTVIRGDVLS